MKIAILGAGVFGTALGGILANKGYDIDYYDSKIERELLKNVTGGAKIIVLAVPSSVVPYLIPHLPKNKTLVVATKGFLNDSLFCEFKDYAVISGPGFANDIKSHCTIKLTTTSQEIAEMFGTDFLSFDITDDKKGVLMCGSLKNVYAILAGYLNLKPDTANYDNFIHDVVKEMKQILKINGARPETVDLACGVADLKIT